MKKAAVSLSFGIVISIAGLTGFLAWFTFTRLAGELTMALKVVIGAGTLAGVVLAGGVAVFGLGIIRERFYQAKQDTRLKNLAADELKVRIVLQSRIFHNARAGDQVYEFDALAGITRPLHLMGDPDRWQLHQLSHARVRQAHPPAPELAEGPPAVAELSDGQPELLEALAIEQRLLLLGPSGSGKSSLLRHVVAKKLGTVDQVLLCDPHGSRPKWGANIDAVGFGEDFEAILSTFQQLEWLHKQRIRQVAEGAPERSFPVTLCVIEEIQALVGYFKKNRKDVDLGYYVRMFLTRTRKTSIDVIVVTQSDTVKALGLEGFGKNRDAFAYAKTMGRQGRGHRVEYVNEFEDNFVFDAPPLWPDTQPVGVVPQQIARLGPAPTSEQYKIIDALIADPEASDYKIGMDVWGKKGTSYKAKIEEVRRLFGPL